MDSVKTSDVRLRVWQTFKGVTPDGLFGYWTEADKLKGWWTEAAALNPVPGGHYRYVSRDGHTLSGSFSEVTPGKRLAFSFQQEGEPSAETQVVVDFEPRDVHTLLTVTQGFYGEGEADKQAFQSQLDDWANLFRRLKAVVSQN